MKMLRSCRLLLWQVALRLSYNVVIGKTIQKRLFSDIRHFAVVSAFLSMVVQPGLNLNVGLGFFEHDLCLCGLCRISWLPSKS